MKELENVAKWRMVALSLTGDAMLADDLFQDVALEILERNPNVQSPEGYVFIAMYRKWNDARRRFRHKYRTPLAEIFDVAQEDRDWPDFNRLMEGKDDLDVAMLECWADGMSFRAMSAKTGVHYSTIAKRLKVLRDELRRCIERD